MSAHYHRWNKAFSQQQYHDAYAHASRALSDDPGDYRALYMASLSMLHAGHVGTAWNLMVRSAELSPDDENNALNGVGRCVQEMGRYDEALAWFNKAHEVNPDDFHARNNIALCHLNLGRFQEAEEWAEKALSAENMEPAGYDNLALACLGMGRFEEGWRHYAKSLGMPKRVERTYGNERRWEGPEKDRAWREQGMGHTLSGSVIVYGEQGVGDEVLFSSCLPDFCADVEYPIIETKPYLEGLFRRSFPKAEVMGTYYEEVKAEGLDGRASFCDLPRWYRPTKESFDRDPHLVADPERRTMVRALLDGLPGKKKIGIAWNGGGPATRGAERSADLQSLYSDFNDLDVMLVSLEYKGNGGEVLRQIEGMERIRHFPFLTNTKDYDDTAALVAELDGVVSVTTSVVHLAGALGTPVHILVPEPSTWKYSMAVNPDEDFYWWRSAKLIRAKSGSWDIKQAIERCVS